MYIYIYIYIYTNTYALNVVSYLVLTFLVQDPGHLSPGQLWIWLHKRMRKCFLDKFTHASS